jgi:hypothetical protein
MVSTFFRRSIRAFERRWGYDGSYMHEILDEAGPGAVVPLEFLGRVSRYRKHVPASVYFAAKIAASIEADCGPCAQLAVTMAEAAGVDRATLRALAASDPGALGADERLAYDFARATLTREAGSDELRAGVLARWGRRGLVSLAYGIVAGQAFPTFKAAIGHATACTRLHVGGSEVARRVTQPA